MDCQVYRQELKFYINAADLLELRSRLKHVARPDANVGADNRYKVRSLYFDNYSDKAVTDKLSGQSRREKFRLRYYRDDTGFIRLEKKSKVNKGCHKQSELLPLETCESILDGRFAGASSLASSMQTPLLTELYAKTRFQQLRPRTIVDYHREAYVFPAGNVRITLDSGIRTSDHITGFLDAQLPTIPAANATILEVKYDLFLPDVIRDVIQLGSRHRTEFSKYVVARLV